MCGLRQPVELTDEVFVQVLLGCVKVYLVVSFLSEPVLSGFTTASAILIAASQIKHVLGLPIPRGNLPSMLVYAYNNIKDANGTAIVFGVVGVLVLDWVKKLNAAISSGL